MVTRKQAILDILNLTPNEWVNGDRLMQSDTGGGRFGARIEELRKDGFNIEGRRHPDSRRDIWQYRIININTKRAVGFWSCTSCGEEVTADLAGSGVVSVDPNFVELMCPRCRKRRFFKKNKS